MQDVIKLAACLKSADGVCEDSREDKIDRIEGDLSGWLAEMPKPEADHLLRTLLAVAVSIEADRHGEAQSAFSVAVCNLALREQSA